MKFVIFCHSLVSCWNHGNAHFLRGIASELLARGHTVDVYEPRNGWSMSQLLSDQGEDAFTDFEQAFPHLASHRYGAELDCAHALDGADVVLVHEWNDPELVRRIGELRAAAGEGPAAFRLFFHDTHHRCVSAPHELDAFDLSAYDGVLAFGAVVRDAYLARGWARRAWTWHEAADVRTFRRCAAGRIEGDLVWIGNWGDGERARELREFLIDPVRLLGLRAVVYGVRYPEAALRTLEEAGIEYRGWIPNHRVPQVFARFRATIHVPRSFYRDVVRGVPTIRPFEALACGIPLVSAPWDDSEALFAAGRDYLVARDGGEMIKQLYMLRKDDKYAASIAAHGRDTIEARHTCAHRVDELLRICAALDAEESGTAPGPDADEAAAARALAVEPRRHIA